ncbi:MAG: CoA transferase, partial [Desulfobacterales bacterium]|nr:CoA transferase [Desulfobacterales bacterium]
MTMPLQGIRVIDATRWAFGPYAARCLADMGAEVIKVEDPVTGDGSRWTHKSRDIDIGGDKKMNALFELLNKGKKGIALDLGKERGREVLYDLVRKSDVFMTSNLPKSRKKLGIEYETLAALNPGLVYAQCGAWGEEGPRREDMAWD